MVVFIVLTEVKTLPNPLKGR
uniref:Uncharacterized protein n=1 Tax=Rhizophora mucronata TaxID=61149 RepID=A0A2P2NTW1_RHIMU